MTVNAKTAAAESLAAARPGLIALSHSIHAHPELGFEEVLAASWLAEALSGVGFEVQMGVCGLPTAFVARSGHGPLHIAICAEYDALPGIGHACGHNIIAAAAVGAGIAAADVADEIGLTISVIGTPAEEVGNAGGKILMLERGAFEGVHAAMMVHPAPWDVVEPVIVAAACFEVEYAGKAAHAAAFPEHGINAADAMTVAQTAIGLLRQQIRPSDRIHGIITNGGDAPNIIPARTTAKYMVRSQTLDELKELYPKVRRCFEAGALASGATLNLTGGEKPYAQMRHDPEMAVLYRRNAEAIGRNFPELGGQAQRMTASTDMGNVSLVIPAIHPLLGIESFPAVNHQPEFTVHCVSTAADKALMDGALAMAWTAIAAGADEGICRRLVTRTSE